MAVHTCISRKSLEVTIPLVDRYADAEVIGECDTHANSVHIKRYEGAVLGTWEHNGYDDSDFYAVVWDGERLCSIEYATTRGWTYHNAATEDATAEVREAARAWLLERDVRAWVEATAIDAATVEKGKRVRVIKGRKVPIGTEGEVFWLGQNRYGWRVGLKDAEGTVHWTAEANCEVIEPAQYMTSIEEIAETSARRVEQIGRGRMSGILQNYMNEDAPGYAKQCSGAWCSAYRSYGGAHGGRITDLNVDRIEAGQALVTEDLIGAALHCAADARINQQERDAA